MGATTREDIYRIAMAAGKDSGNRSARKAGRETWNVDDYNKAVDTAARLRDELTRALLVKRVPAP
jgi:hypothetical protein